MLRYADWLQVKLHPDFYQPRPFNNYAAVLLLRTQMANGSGESIDESVFLDLVKDFDRLSQQGQVIKN